MIFDWIQDFRPDWIQAICSVVTLILTLVSILFALRQLRSVSQQLTIQNFSDYTKRYQEIILSLPENVNDDQFQIEDLHEPDREKLMRSMRAYYDMSFEEYWLNQTGLIWKPIWTIWSGGMKTACSRPAFRQAWQIIGNDSDYGVEFHQFIDKLTGLTTKPRS